MFEQMFVNNKGIMMSYEDLQFMAAENAGEKGTAYTEEMNELLSEYELYVECEEDDEDDDYNPVMAWFDMIEECFMQE